MSAVFLKILNMSITAGWLILAVILTRLLLKKAPKWIPCLLWGLVALRLICPFSLESLLSLIPSSETVPTDIAQQGRPQINSGIQVLDDIINPVFTETFAPSPLASANPLQTLLLVAAGIWILGILVMLAYAIISYLKLRKTVAVCVPVGARIFACDEVKAPFILGVFRPAIYIPSSMKGETLNHVIRHETAHLQRLDHWWKPLGFLLLSIHWFNPLCWIAYTLLCRDIEMACDERVIRNMDREDLAAYSQALLDCSFPRKRIAACPLAFGEVGVKQRVKGVLNYKKPAFWIILIAVAACIVLAVCLMTNPKTDPATDPDSEKYYSIRYELGDTAGHFIGLPTRAKAGDWVEIKTEVLHGTDIHVYVEVREIEKSYRGSDYWGYSFFMPEKDVFVSARFYSKDEMYQPAITDALKEKYPEYFGLSTAKGLEVYVWQMSEKSYYFGVMPGTNREKTFQELWNLRGVTAEEMKAILASYDIEEENVFVIPYQNPLSSYIAEYWIMEKDEDMSSVMRRREAYVERIRAMLFDSQKNN